MGLFLCDICNQELGTVPHVCKEEDVIGYIHHLEELSRGAQNKLQHIEDQVLKLVEKLPDLSGPECTISSDLVRAIWEAVDCQWYEAKTADSFLARWMAMHHVLRFSFDLFRTRGIMTTADKLTRLVEACETAKEVLGYQDSVFNLNVADLLKELK